MTYLRQRVLSLQLISQRRVSVVYMCTATLPTGEQSVREAINQLVLFRGLSIQDHSKVHYGANSRTIAEQESFRLVPE